MNPTEPGRSEPISRIEQLLREMTLEEKLGQMSQHPYGIGDQNDVHARLRKGQIGSFLNVGSLDVRNELQRIALEETRLGIPLIFGRDVIHGFKTIFPITLGQSASFDPTLVERAASVAAHEAAETGIDWTFAPMVDVSRDPRWGRIAESCGEDPHLSARLGAAMVRGFQGDDITDGKHLAACAKHFAGYGASESGKDYNTTWIPEGLLRDLHLPPFKACVDAGVLTLMSAFNDLNGIPASANSLTLRQILKQEWGFDGFVVSDWAAVMELLQHGLCADAKAAAGECVNAGLDMEMATTAYREHLAQLISEGLVSDSVVDEAVRRILLVKERLNLFDSPYKKAPTNSVILSSAHRQVARDLATESIVLLKNERGLLPLAAQVKPLALVGPLAQDAGNQLGCWALDGDGGDAVTLRTALEQRLEPGQLLFAPGLVDSRSSDERFIDDAVRVVAQAEVAIVCVGEDADLSGEAKCRAFLDLPGAQGKLIERLAETGTPLVLVFMAGRPLIVEKPCERASAVLFAWHLGTEAGPALADVLFGVVPPSGKLPISFPRAEGQIPVYYGRKNTGRPPQTDRKGVPTGTPLDPVDFDSSYVDLEVTPLFPFGFGLSYTSFAYSSLSVSPSSSKLGSKVRVSVDVTNSGARAGTEIAQLYVRDLVASLTRPIRELKGFQRITLQPGASQRISFELGEDELAFAGRDMRPTIEPGRFEVFVGGDSTATLSASFEWV